MKLSLSMLLITMSLTGLKASADLCATAQNMDLAKINEKLTGVTLISPSTFESGQLVGGVAVDPRDNESIKIELNVNGSVETWSQTDLAYFSIRCNGELINVASALKNSGVLCVPKAYESVIPNVKYDIQCNEVRKVSCSVTRAHEFLETKLPEQVFTLQQDKKQKNSFTSEVSLDTGAGGKEPVTLSLFTNQSQGDLLGLQINIGAQPINVGSYSGQVSIDTRKVFEDPNGKQPSAWTVVTCKKLN